MNAMHKTLWIFAAAFALFASGCKPRDVGYADSSRIVKEVTRFQSVRDSVNHYNENWNKEARDLDSLAKDLAAQITGMKKAGPAMDSLVQKYNNKQRDLQRFVQASTEKSHKLEGELMAPHLKKINECLQDFLKVNHLLLLLGTQQGGTILAGDNSADYSDKAIEYLNTNCKE